MICIGSHHCRLWGLILLCSVPVPALPDEKPDRLVIATWNLEWFYDENRTDNHSDLSRKQSAPNRKDWEWKRDGVAGVIARIKPAILALQEVENRRVLQYLVSRLRKQHNLSYRYAFIEGRDSFTEQDVGILYLSGLVEYCRREQSREMYDSQKYYNLSKHLIGRFEWGSGTDKESLMVLTAHFRAGEKNAEIRRRQARLIRHWIEPELAAGRNVVVLGDFNVERTFAQTSERSPIGVLRGLPTESPMDDLADAHQFIRPARRGTHLINKQFDRILLSRSLMIDQPGKRDLVFGSANCRAELVIKGSKDRDHRPGLYRIPVAERDLSDHYPVVVELRFR